MNDRDLYRGKTGQEKWAIGNLLWENDKHYIATFYNGTLEMVEVDPSTVGQCTGLRDRTGKLVFEGDIAKWGHIEGYGENPYRIAQVVLNPDIQYHSQVGMFRHGNFVYADTTDKALEVIGTIHTTPELMEGNNEQTD